jgi:predicted transcriptional regulator
MTLTEKQKEVFEILKRGDSLNLYPSYQQMAEELDITTPAIKQRVDGLIRKGYVEMTGARKYKIIKEE